MQHYYIRNPSAYLAVPQNIEAFNFCLFAIGFTGGLQLTLVFFTTFLSTSKFGVTNL